MVLSYRQRPYHTASRAPHPNLHRLALHCFARYAVRSRLFRRTGSTYQTSSRQRSQIFTGAKRTVSPLPLVTILVRLLRRAADHQERGRALWSQLSREAQAVTCSSPPRPTEKATRRERQAQTARLK